MKVSEFYLEIIRNFRLQMDFTDFLIYTKINWKKFYYFIWFFLLMTLISGFIVGQSITPFYVYQMYSQTLKTQKSYTSFNIEVNGEYFNLYKLSKEREDILYYNFDRYISLKDSKGYDKYYFKLKKIDKYNLIPDFIYNKIFSIDIYNKNKHKKWLHNLLAYNYKGKIKTIRIYKVRYLFDSTYNVRVFTKTDIDYFLYD